MLTEQQQANEEIFKHIIELVNKLNIQRKDDGRTEDCVFFIGVQNHKEKGIDKINVATVFSGSEAGLADGLNQLIEDKTNPIAGPILNAASNILESTGNPALMAVGGMVADYCQLAYNGIECNCAKCRAERGAKECKGN